MHLGSQDHFRVSSITFCHYRKFLFSYYFRRYRDVFESMFGAVLLIQFLITEISVCITAVYVFFAESKGEIIYTGSYFICVLIEICLPCYCGNEIAHENNQFTTALFSCNWMDQDRKFKKALIFIMQKTEKPLEIYAGGIVRVSISTLLAVGYCGL